MTGWGTRLRSGFLVAAALAVAGWAMGTAGVASAHGLPGAQAEAQGDTGVDPYTFPNIRLCCERKPGVRRNGNGPRPPYGPDTPSRYVTVNCGMPTEAPYTYGSIQEGLARIDGAGTVYVVPGTACEISGVVFSGPVTVTTRGYGYGSRAKLVAAEACPVVSSGRSGAPVVFGGLDIDGCIAVTSGELQLDEVNIAWRGRDAAISISNGSLDMRRSTVRAREGAVSAVSAGRVWIDDSRLATTPSGPQVLRIGAANVKLSDVQVKGGRIGVLLDSVSESLTLNKVNVVRSEPEEPYPPTNGGDQGIVIGGAQAMQDLPWLSGMEAHRILIQSGSVSGYGVGISIGDGSSVVVQDMTVNAAAQGISVAAGAYAQLINNRISGSNVAGISLQAGARGSADHNDVKCSHGRCVCYGGDCSSRSNYVFGNGAFRMTDTDCDD